MAAKKKKTPRRQTAREASGPVVLEGTLIPPRGARFGIVASRFNGFIVGQLIEGAIDALVRHGVSPDDITVVRVPGSWETPAAVARVANSGQVDAVIALGAVIRGGTPHFDYVAGEVAKGVASAAAAGVPVTFGVITTDDVAQAIDRAGVKTGNKGADAALAALEMVSLGKVMDEAGF